MIYLSVWLPLPVITMLKRYGFTAHAGANALLQTAAQSSGRFANVCLIGLSFGLGGCAFFNSPVDDLGPISPGAPPPLSTSLPPQLPDSDTRTSSAPNSEILQPLPQSVPETTAVTGAQTSTLPTLPGQAYLTVASLIDIPEDATNLAFIHFTQSNSATRTLAVCQAAMKNLPLVPVENIPSGAETVLVWPVTNSDSGTSCLEMISNYEALDISNATAERVNSSSRGPYLLTRNSRQNKRLIYDLSFITASKFATAIDEWRSLLGSDATNWPEYRSAR